MKLKKYRVLKKTPKPIMNAGRMVVLEHDNIVYLKEDRQVRVLQQQGYIHMIEEFKKQEKEEQPQEEMKIEEEKVEEMFEYKPKKKKGKKKKHKHVESSAKEAEDQMEQE